MNLCTFFLYSHLSVIALPQQHMPMSPKPSLISHTLRSSGANLFLQKVERETKYSRSNNSAEYVIPEDNMANASAMGIVLGMLRVMNVDSKRFGQSRLTGLAFTLVRQKTIRRQTRRLRGGDRLKIFIYQDDSIRLTLNKSTARSRALALSRMRFAEPEKQVNTVFVIQNAGQYVQDVSRLSNVLEENKRVEYTVPADNMPQASAMGTVLGMLHALKIQAHEFGQSRLQGLALKMVLRREIKRRARDFRKGDIFTIALTGDGKLALNISSRLRYRKKPRRYRRFAQVQEQVRPPRIAGKREADQKLASLSDETIINDADDSLDDELDAAFKPENIFKNNITAIIDETIEGLQMPKDKTGPLKEKLTTYLTGWSKTAVKVDDQFVTGFVNVITQEMLKLTPDGDAKKIELSLRNGLKQEHDFYDTKEEALRETAKEILKTAKILQKTAQ